MNKVWMDEYMDEQRDSKHIYKKLKQWHGDQYYHHYKRISLFQYIFLILIFPSIIVKLAFLQFTPPVVSLMSLMTDYDLNHSCLMSSYESVRTDEASHVSGTTPDAQPEQHSSSSPPSLSTLDGLSQSHHLIISQGLFSHEPRNLAPITNKIDNPQLVHLIINY